MEEKLKGQHDRFTVRVALHLPSITSCQRSEPSKGTKQSMVTFDHNFEFLGL